VSVQADRTGNGWIVRWRENGQQKSRKFDLKRHAEAWEREIKQRKQLGPIALSQLTEKGPTLAGLEKGTLERYANIYQLHVAPMLAQVPIREIKVSTLREWQATQLKQGVGAETVRKARTFISSVMRHAAESEAIPANPVSLVRPPKRAHKEDVRPLPPSEVEAIRATLLNPPDRVIPASKVGQRVREAYTVPAPGTPLTWQLDALIVSLIAYAGLRTQEVRALRFSDVQENTIRIQRAADDDGVLKSTKTEKKRNVKILPPLAQDLENYWIACGRPAKRLFIVSGTEKAWTKSDWNKWAQDRWKPACHTVALDPIPRVYDLRHSFASLLLAEGRRAHYVARQMGNTPPMVDRVYGHILDELEDSKDVEAVTEILNARENSVRKLCVKEGESRDSDAFLNDETPAFAGATSSTATGIRTRVTAVRGRRPSPLDDSGAG
jgi:integrase